MIGKPLKPKCPVCNEEGIDNLNMIITIITEQPLSLLRRLPDNQPINPETSLNSSWVLWDNKANTIICRSCGFSSSRYQDFEDQRTL